MNLSARNILLLTLMLGVSIASAESADADEPIRIKGKAGMHMGNRNSDWTSSLLNLIDGDTSYGIWPKAVVLLSNQAYNISRQTGDCRIKTGASDTTARSPILLDYLKRASQKGVRVVIRIYPSPANFDTDYRLQTGPVAGAGYCFSTAFRPAWDIRDEMVAIHNYNQANGFTEWAFMPANEPNIEWYFFSTPIQRNNPIALQDMNAYFSYIWTITPQDVKVLTPPMAQAAFAEENFTDANAISPEVAPQNWCGSMRLADPNDPNRTGYGVMHDLYTIYSDGIAWHNYWREGFENYGLCRDYGLHVSYYFPTWMQIFLDGSNKPGFIAEADLFSWQANPPNGVGQDPNQPIHDKDENLGERAAASLRKFMLNEPWKRTEAITAWLLNDNLNSPAVDHDWHEAFNDQTGTERDWFLRWWSLEFHNQYLPVILNQ